MSESLGRDVVVVGAGLSGLVAARRLEARGASVVVVEARDRVGGKIFTQTVEGAAVDFGGRWTGTRHEGVLSLAAELGIDTVPQHSSGRVIHFFGGRRQATSGRVPRFASWAARAEAGMVLRRMARMSARVPLEHPWFAYDAQRLDSMTLDDFKRRSLWTAGARGMIDLCARLLFGVEPRQISLLFFLAYAKAAGGVDALIGVEHGARDLSFAGGAQRLCERLRERIAGDVLLGDPVTLIEQDSGGVAVHTGRTVLHARYVVVALSPALAGRIRYTPPLPAVRDALSQQMPLGAGTKAVAVFERPWWREQGLSGLALADRGPVQMLVDESPADGSRGVLAAFVTGHAARELGQLGPDERRRAILGAAAHLLGLREIVPLAYRDFSWDVDPWSRGMPTSHMGPGTMTALGNVLREPVERIHWAGTETATRWTGFMEGAVQAGERAAGEVLARIGEHRRRTAVSGT